MTIRYTMLVSGLTVLTVLLSACGGGGGDAAKEGKDNKEPTASAAPNNEPVELIFYSNGDTGETFDLRFGGPIRKKFPTYSIKFIERQKGAAATGLPELLASGQRIDI